MNSFPNAMGLVAGFLFLGAILWLIRWLSAAPPPGQAADDRKSARPASSCILVPLMELKTARSTVELACQLASERRARVLLVHVIELPYTVDLNVPFSEAEEQARHLLAVGEQIVRQHDLPAESRVLRHRTTEQAVSELAREVGAQTIVLATGTPHWSSFGRLDHIVAAVMRNAPCRVVIAEQPLPV
jgi:nucleotide-binding universal stress UspA family protein